MTHMEWRIQTPTFSGPQNHHLDHTTPSPPNGLPWHSKRPRISFFLSLSIYCQRTASTRAEHTITTNHISTYHVHGRSSSSSSASTHASKDTRTPSTALLFFRLILGRQSFFDFSSLIFHYFVFLFFSPSIRVELHFTRIPRPFSFFRCIHRGLQGGKFKVLCISFLL